MQKNDHFSAHIASGRLKRDSDDERIYGRGFGRSYVESLVELSGIEPLTSCMPCKRSPS